MTRLSLPHRNAVLTSVKAQGQAADWDDAATDGATSWSGTADAVLVDDTRRVTEGEESSKVVTRSIVLPSDLEVSVGQTLTLTWRGSTLTGVVKSVTRREPPKPLDGTLLVDVELT